MISIHNCYIPGTCLFSIFMAPMNFNEEHPTPIMFSSLSARLKRLGEESSRKLQSQVKVATNKLGEGLIKGILATPVTKG